ncbi:MAG: hypothetical protein N4A72_17685 [Bacteroidales bacterium]|jgi:uncharacterized membrane protein|nr:hypothetical protein [Bacteroidales bacterium]
MAGNKKTILSEIMWIAVAIATMVAVVISITKADYKQTFYFSLLTIVSIFMYIIKRRIRKSQN